MLRLAFSHLAAHRRLMQMQQTGQLLPKKANMQLCAFEPSQAGSDVKGCLSSGS